MATSIPADKAALILTKLKDQANDILSAAHNVELDIFHAQGSGNFPYFVKDTSNRRFNEKTYVWINQCLEKRKEGMPVSLDGDYNGKFLRVVTAISYGLNEADQAELNQSKLEAEEQQAAVLDAWLGAYGEFPEGKVPIDDVFGVILKDWVTQEGTTLQDLLNAPDLSEALGKTPPSGTPVVDVIGSYLEAMGDSLSLLNSISLNNGILRSIRRAINKPSAKNGGFQLNDGTDDFYPEYLMSTPQDNILEGLKSENKVGIGFKMTEFSSSDASLSISGEASFKVPLGFFDIDLGANANYFTNTMTKNTKSIEMDMEFTGVTVVKFGPEPFRTAGRKGWHFTDAIREAIAIGKQDISGFRFAPKPNVDFTKNGDFGFINAVAISQYPTITIKVASSDYKKIKTDFDAAAEADLKLDFLGMPLGAGLSGSYKQNDVSIDEASGTITIVLTPPVDSIAGLTKEATAFILGVQTEYPATE